MAESRQLNLRLAANDRDRLEALAFVRRTTATALSRDVVLDYLAQHSDEAGLDSALKALREHDDAVTPTNVTALHGGGDRS